MSRAAKDELSTKDTEDGKLSDNDTVLGLVKIHRTHSQKLPEGCPLCQRVEAFGWEAEVVKDLVQKQSVNLSCLLGCTGAG